MKNPFVDKRRNPVNQQRLFESIPNARPKEVEHTRPIPTIIGDATVKYCLTSKGIDSKTAISARNRKILLLIKDGKTSATDLAPHIPLPLKTIAVELVILQKEGLISPLG